MGPPRRFVSPLAIYALYLRFKVRLFLLGLAALFHLVPTLFRPLIQLSYERMLELREEAEDLDLQERRLQAELSAMSDSSEDESG